MPTIDDIVALADKNDVAVVPNNPKRSDLVDALNRASSIYGIDFLSYMAHLAFSDKKVAMKLMDKLIPNLSNQEVKTESTVTVSVSELIQSNRNTRENMLDEVSSPKELEELEEPKYPSTSKYTEQECSIYQECSDTDDTDDTIDLNKIEDILEAEIIDE